MRLPSWRLTLRAVTRLSWVVVVIWLATDRDSEALLAFLSGVAALLIPFRTPDTAIGKYTPTPKQCQRNRRAMLELIRNTWIEGVFEQSLHGVVLIELGLEEQPDAVERPWDVLVQMPGEPSHTLSRVTTRPASPDRVVHRIHPVTAAQRSCLSHGPMYT